MSSLEEKLAKLSVEKRQQILKKLLNKESPKENQNSITKVDRSTSIPLSFGQQRLWFLDKLEESKAHLYNEFSATTLSGLLHISLLEKCLAEIINRHEILRSCFPDSKGIPAQHIKTAISSNIILLNLRHLPPQAQKEKVQQSAIEESQKPFDLATGPLFRFKLFHIDANTHVFFMCMHHIVCDNWSGAIFQRELIQLYDAFSRQLSSPLPALTIQYADYSAWQKRWLTQEREDQQFSYWQNKLAKSPTILNLPIDKPRPSTQKFQGARLTVQLSTQLTQQLKQLSQQSGTTLFMTLLASFACLLNRYSQQQSIIIGSAVSNRQQQECEDLIGFFINTLMFRIDINDTLTVNELLAQVKQTALEAYNHQDIPFERLVERLQPERSLSHSPLFQTMLVLHNAPEKNQSVSGLSFETLTIEKTSASFDITLLMKESSEGLLCEWEYNTDLFYQDTIARMAQHWQNLLEGFCHNPQYNVSQLPLLTATEITQLSLWSQVEQNHTETQTIIDLFEQQPIKTPGAIAVIFEQQQLSYQQLNEQANQLAHYLIEQGVGTDTLVALCIDRSLSMIVALLGVLKAGGAYVPIDPDYPAQRIDFMLSDSRASMLITKQDILKHIQQYQGPCLCLDGDSSMITSYPKTNPNCKSNPQQLAYVIYTSGSTGKPKGVAIEHQSTVSLLKWAKTIFTLEQLNTVLASTSLSFDLSVFEIFLPLITGQKIVLVTNALDLLKRPENYEISLINTVPSVIVELLKANAIPDTVKVVNLAGEPLKNNVVQKIYQIDTVDHVYNLYGPSEDTTYSTFTRIEKGISKEPTIGKPIANTQVYILDKHLQRQPIGIYGELHIGGAGLARGYLHRPELSAEKFIADPFSINTNARLYKTGDLARWQANGNLEFLGRIDRQIKLRGFRIELGEIEALLTQHEAVKEAVVVLHETDSNKSLVAYITLDEDTENNGAVELRNWLKKRLPDYMVPTGIIALAALPLTPNGKINYNALPKPELQIADAQQTASNACESLLLNLYSQLLGVELSSTHSDFFSAGGHSLLATQLITRIRDSFNVEIPLRAIFEYPKIHDLAHFIGQQQGHPVLPSITTQTDDEPLVLSFAQQRLWFLDQLEGGSATYHIPALLQLDGILHQTALQHALADLVERHQSLRLCFPENDGQPCIKLLSAYKPLTKTDLSHLDSTKQQQHIETLTTQFINQEFQLSSGPLLRLQLLTLSDTRHLLLFNIHHIIADGRSMEVLLTEWVSLYQSRCQKQATKLIKPTIQYTDYSAWQRRWLNDEVLAQQLAYWQTKLLDAPDFLELPTDFARPPVIQFNGRIMPFTVDSKLTKDLKTLSKQSNSTLYMLLLSAYSVLLSRYSSHTDIIIGSPVSNRNNLETEGLIGFFVNTLALRIDLSGQPDFNTLLKRVRQTSLEAYSYQDIPFEHIIEAIQPIRHLDRTPLFQVMFGLQTGPKDHSELIDLNITPLAVESQSARCDLSLLMTETEHGLEAVIEYSSDLFHADTIKRLINHFTTLLNDIVKQPEQNIHHLQLLDSQELSQLKIWNKTETAYPRSTSIQQEFALQAIKRPHELALIFNDIQLSYQQLNSKANQLAHYLKSLDLGPNQIVGVHLQRSTEQIITLLGILKAGCAYLALDVAYPSEILSYMVDEAEVAVLISQQSLSSQPFIQATHVIYIDSILSDQHLASYSDTNPKFESNEDQLAYVSYTSGSSSKPKGVCIPHKAVIRLVKNTDFMLFSPEQTFLSFAPLAFDASTLEIWGALLNGARLVLMPPEAASLEALGQVIKQQSVDTLWLTSGLFNQMVDERLDDLKGVRQLLSGGDVLSPTHIKKAISGLPNTQFINGYGPTENTTFTCCYNISLADCDAAIPIGRPISNSQAYILDQYLQPVPVGVIGELYAGGDGLAQGYLNQTNLTTEKFIETELFGQHQRLYKTGDFGRYRKNGVIEFLGRIDNQVKLRGFRIELDAISTTLNQHPAIQESIAIIKTISTSDQRLLAYCVIKADIEFDEVACRTYLKHQLPDYMQPSALITLDKLPLTANGKIDQKALPDDLQLDNENLNAPRTAVEEILHGLWCEILHLETVDINADFFDCGGHSLLATQLISRIRRHFGIELPLRSLFEASTIFRLAVHIEAMRGQNCVQKPPIVPSLQTEPELSFAQERLWFLDQLEPNNPFYNVPLALRLTGDLSIHALEQSLSYIIERHAALRTTFSKINGKPVIKLQSTAPELVVKTCSSTQFELLVRAEAEKTFDLAHNMLIRMTLLKLSEHEHVLLLTLHHIVADGWSLGILIKELLTLYPALLKQKTPELAPLAIQYTDFAQWQRQWLSGDQLNTQFNYWRNQLEGAPPSLNLPTDNPRPAVQSFQGSSELFHIDETTTLALKQLTRQHGSTLFMTLLSAFTVLLNRYSNQDDMVIGAPIANRNHAEIEPLIGFFVNTLALRVKFTNELSFSELLAQVRLTALDAYSHQDLPFEKLVDVLKIERDLSRNPLFQVMFALQNAPAEQLSLPGLEVTPLYNKRHTALFDMVLDIWEDEEQLTAVLEYNTDLFEATTILRFISHFKNLLQAIIEQPECPVSQLVFLDTAETDQVLRLGEGTIIKYPIDKPLHQLFEQQTMQMPDRIAAVHRPFTNTITEISYVQLNQRANQIAHALRELNIQSNTFVGILESRGIDYLCAMLGILKAGAAFLPLDPNYPNSRIQYMMANSQVKVLISRHQFAEKIAEMQQDTALNTIISFDDPQDDFSLPILWGDALNRQPISNPLLINQPSDIAYILYTSGSTGLPKGALVRHNGAVNHAFAEFDALSFHLDSAFLQSAPSSSDISVWQYLAPLLIGGRCVIIDFETVCDASQLFQAIRDQAVTIIELVPVVLQNLLDYATTLSENIRQLPDLEYAMVTGEAVSTGLVNQWLSLYPEIPLVNAYGPTEAADDICQAVLDKPLLASQINVPIGKPIANVNLYLLDKQQQLIPLGTYGEICVSGIGVGAGYWDNTEKTRESFVINPFRNCYDEYHEIIYRTGDLGRWLPCGELEFIGRSDQQVKIRGFRIELGEIEGILAQYPAIKENVVIVRKNNAPDDKQLAAYFVANMQNQTLDDDINQLHNEQIELWQDLHEDSYSNTPSHTDLTFNIIGWDSNYTGQQLADADMREYIEHTIAAILSLQPRNMLEIGCGTGLLMYQLVPHCLSYTGTDLSSVALQRLENTKDELSIPGLQQARFLTKIADDFSGFNENSFDTVVINSVVQYFPSIDYLVKVITGLLKIIKPGGAIFIGDVRDLTLLKAFHTSVQLFKSRANDTAGQLQHRIQQHLLQEQEMAISPDFFNALKDGFPQISRVDIRPKRGLIRNEMSCFRYDVTLHLNDSKTSHDWHPDWLTWQQQPLSIEAIEALLHTEQPSYLALNGVVNARVADELNMLSWLDEADSNTAITALQQSSIQLKALDPQSLWQLSEKIPYSVHIGSIINDSLPAGCFNVIFKHNNTSVTTAQISASLFPVTSDRELQNWSQYANNPLQEKFARTLIPKLRSFLKEKLPEHMIPVHFVSLEQLPLLPNGKIDRDNLPAPDAWQHKIDHAYIAPSNPLQQSLSDIWCAVLALEQIGIHDNFFELGGHSLKATQVISRIHKELGVEVSLRELFSRPTIAELAEIIDNRQLSLYQTIPTIATAEYYPLSHAQKRLWVLSQLDELSAGSYQMSETLILQGQLDTAAFKAAFSALTDRHESLRTTFITVDNIPQQKVHQRLEAAFYYNDLSSKPNALTAAQQLALADSQRGFDLELGPLLRISLLKLSEQQHAVLFNMHHIISDGWSMKVLEKDFLLYYQALAEKTSSPATITDLLPPLTIQYRDYAAWQNQQLQNETSTTHRDYWLQQLAGEIPVLNLPTDFPRPPIKTFTGKTHSFNFSALQYQGLTSLSSEHEVSLFMTLTALVKTLFFRYSQQQDMIIGTPIAGRDQFELESQIGFYINTLLLRSQLEPAMSFNTLLAQIKQTTLAAYEHQIYPFDRLVLDLNPERDVSRSPLFDVMLVMQNVGNHDQQFKNLHVKPLPVDYGHSQFDMTLSFETDDDGLRMTVWYNTDLYLSSRIERLCGHLQTLTDSILADSSTVLAQLSLLPHAEQNLLLQTNNSDSTVSSSTETLVSLFQQQVSKTPNTIAVCYKDQHLSYKEINTRANLVAHHLLDQGIVNNSYVGLCVERSLDMIIGILAILKAGAAYVPLDPTYPIERLAFMQKDSGLNYVLTQTSVWQKIQQHTQFVSTQAIYLDCDQLAMTSKQSNPSVTINSNDIAYIIYTSGSTGKPKGVLISHANVVRLFTSTEDWFNFDQNDVWTLFHSYAFDFSVWELWGALLYGGRLVVVPYHTSRSPEAFYQLLHDEQVSVLNQTPSAFRQLIETENTTQNTLTLNLRTVIFGGEALDMQSLRPWFERHSEQKPQLINMYGITETTVHVTYKSIFLADLEHPSSNIGKAIPDLQLYVLDPQGQLTPYGIPGELYVGGAGLAHGYLNRTELTAEKFITNPFNTAMRLYRTGDLVRYLDNGELDYLGRIDNQVKIRGFRIELGEIESQLTKHPDISDALVLAKTQDEQPRLIGYFIVNTEKNVPNTNELRSFLQQNLPDYMIPSALIALDAFPITPSGKTDSRALLVLEKQRPTLDSHYVAPHSSLEQVLSEFWQQALELPQVGILDNIFDLGAHSVLVIQIRNKLKTHLNRDVPAVLLFQYPTIQSLANHLDTQDKAIDQQSQSQSINRAKQRRQARKRRQNTI